MDKTHAFNQYIESMTEIRALSTPSFDGLENAGDYSKRLRENFARIGILAAKNREFLNTALFPLLRSDEALSKEEEEEMDSFCEKLLNASELENLDPAIISMVADRLLSNAQRKGELLSQIHYMDVWMSTLYALMNMTERLTEYPQISMEYRKKGFELGDIFLSLREHERFSSIPDEESRELVLTNSRFISAFYENLCGDPGRNSRDLALLEENLALCGDRFYRPLVPDYDWDCHKFRVLVNYACATDYHNARGFDAEQLSLICDKAEELWALMQSDPEKYSKYDSERYLQILLARNRFLAGRADEKEYRETLLSFYEERITDDFEMGGIAENLLLPTELLCLLDGKTLTDADKELLDTLYHGVITYTFRMPNTGILSYMLEYTSHFLRHFIEVEGGMRFDEMMLDLLAAMHPPTYVHSRMVAQFTGCLCGHLIDMHPELFVGILECDSVEKVIDRRGDLIHFAHQAALCHDAGKLFIFDTVFIYGRNLQDMEFELIKTHPKMGAKILSRYPSTKDYAEVALGHHKWYDNAKGYPEEFDTSKSSLKTVIDLVLCADCLDAATDTIGRSYNRGKTMDDFIGELKEGSGTRYAPWLLELVAKEEVLADLLFLLEDGREKNYYNTYHLLKNVDQSVTPHSAV